MRRGSAAGAAHIHRTADAMPGVRDSITIEPEKVAAVRFMSYR